MSQGAPPGADYNQWRGAGWPNYGWYSSDEEVPTCPTPPHRPVVPGPEAPSSPTSEGTWSPVPAPDPPRDADHPPVSVAPPDDGPDPPANPPRDPDPPVEA